MQQSFCNEFQKGFKKARQKLQKDCCIYINTFCSEIFQKACQTARRAGKAALLPNPEGGRGWCWWSFFVFRAYQ